MSTCPAVPKKPFARKPPVKLIAPMTCNGYCGFVVPIPTYPVLRILNLSVPFVLILTVSSDGNPKYVSVSPPECRI